MNITERQKQLFITGYCEAALWSSSDVHPVTGEDIELDQYEWGEGEEQKRQAECEDFINYALPLLLQYVEQVSHAPEYDGWELAGHDFWLTRCGHGAGYWDRGLGKLGEQLTEAAKSFGNIDLYLDDGEFVYS